MLTDLPPTGPTRSWPTRDTAPRPSRPNSTALVSSCCARPARNEAPRHDAGFLCPLRQRIESVFDTLKDQLGLERHVGFTPNGVVTRVTQRMLALTAAIRHTTPPAIPLYDSCPLRPLTILGINHPVRGTKMKN